MKAPSHADRFVKVNAYLSDENFGYENWHARQFGASGDGKRPAVLILCADIEEQRAAMAYLEERAAAKAGQ